MPRYDVHIQLTPLSEFNGTKFYSFGYQRTFKVTGIQKLINSFAKYLLTPVGTDPLDKTYGTDFTNLMGSNVTPTDAQDVLVLAVDKTVKALQLLQSVDTPDSERIATATITRFIVLPDIQGFAAQVYIENAANQGLEFLIPTLEAKG